MDEIKNIDELLEKIDTLTNLVEQMYLAHVLGDDEKFRSLHAEAGELGFVITNYLQAQ